MTIIDLLHSEIRRRVSLFRCPMCHKGLTFDQVLHCNNCHRMYWKANQGILSLCSLSVSQDEKDHIKCFWGDIYRQWYQTDDDELTKDSLLRGLEELENMFRGRNHLAVTEMNLLSLKGKEVLEIGSGAGAHSALFRRYGAHVTAVDITPERVAASMNKMILLSDLGGGSGLAIQADAENLPFCDNAFDIVYSNGVLHHSANTDLAISEAYRVLKPGGEAKLMLYSRHSARFWCRLFLKGLLSGLMMRLSEPEWLGRVTEGTPHFQSIPNPFTRVYSKRELRRLLKSFETLRLRRNGFFFTDLPLPLVGKLREGLTQLCGARPHNGGKLVYGKPIIPEMPIELWLGRGLGFCWNVNASKPNEASISI